ncbi:response regulator [Roseomonas sp. OT10]|uniref:hybrid sensor histidine kinase/response regulator n=1 Tax=Roseomonas cutis TaxID=2897332 RepID=UPI001E58C5EC|nr:response regulator [Roseomonas sp. OT10]UFN48096.1 response regulator [Roseomonas sp. OT10]
MSDFRQELLAAFAAEHQEHLGAIRAALAEAEQGRPADLRDIFRRAHSLKGAARAVDLPVVEALAHRLEALLARVLEGQASLDGPTVAVVQQGLDGVEGYVAALEGGATPPTPDAALQALDRWLAETVPEARQAAPPEVPAPAVAADAAPPAAPEGAADPAASGFPAGGTLRVQAAQVDELAAAVHELFGTLQRQEAAAEALRGLAAGLRSLRRRWDVVRPGLLAGEGTRASAPRLRELDHEMAALTRRAIALAREQRGAVWAADLAARRLREGFERISLVPAETVLGGLGRMARDLAREAGREVSVRLEGLELQADRGVLQALKDPVLHLLRNAVGHGIEPPERRRARGKPERGEVVLRLASQGGRLLLSVADDGAGPDLARIEATALRRGLLPPRAPGAPALPPDQLLSLVFEPGFSTAEAVDRLSGRGMGLSVVAEAARKLRGTALMRARRPWGTEMVLEVPLSAARLPVLLVGAAGRRYGFPTHAVERLLRLPAAGLERMEGQPTARIALGGQDVIAPVVSLLALLGSHDTNLPVESGHVSAVLLRRGHRRCAVAVDRLEDVRTLLVGEVDAPGFDAGLVYGASLLEDDAVALVLRPEGLVEGWMRDQGRLAASGLGLPEPARPEAATILVVDDSITTRTLQKSILESQGYRVLLSVDGMEALRVLRGGEAVVDLVIADVEMPRLDGFGLLEAMKADPRLAALPVVLMTSRDEAADVRRGLELGAGAYLTKQKFDQRDLLATIGQLL